MTDLEKAASKPNDCARSHPHENMDAVCELRTEIARLTNENARLKAQRKPWVGLTDDEIGRCLDAADGSMGRLIAAIEAKLKEKNS